MRIGKGTIILSVVIFFVSVIVFGCTKKYIKEMSAEGVLILGKSKIVIPKKSIIGTQVDRVIRDIAWKNSKYDISTDPKRIPTRNQLVPYMEGRLSGILMDYAQVKIIGLTPSNSIKRFKESNKFYGSNGKGNWIFKIDPTKTQYKSAKISSDGLRGVFVDTHGFNMVAEQAIKKGGIHTVIACMDLRAKADAALYLAQNGINCYGPCDRFGFKLIGYKENYPTAATIIGTAPIRRTKTGAVIGDQPIEIGLDELIVIQNTNKGYPDQYCDTPTRYFRELNDKFDLNLNLVEVFADRGCASRVTVVATEMGASVIGVRIMDNSDAIAVSDWLDENPDHRAILFHSAIYKAGYEMFFRYPKQTSFGDFSPIIKRGVKRTVREESSSKGTISITFDDGSASIFSNGLPVLKKHDLPATLFLVTQYIGKDPYYVNWEQVKVLAENNWEIGSHTNTHKKLTEISDEQIKSELNESIKTLQKHGFEPKAFASPCGFYDERTLKFIQEKFSSHRTAWDEKSGPHNGLNSLKDFDPYRISNFNLEYDMTIKEIKEKIDQAVKEKKWLVISLHSIKKGGVKQYQFDAGKLEQIADYISRLVQTEKLKVRTISQMTRKQKQNKKEGEE